MTDYTRNPQTNRMVKIGGTTHRRLVNSGVLKNKRRDPRVLYTLDEGDDIQSIKRQLKETANLNDSESMKYHPSGKYKGKIVKTHKIGRKSKRQPVESESESESEDELLSLYRKLNIAPPSKNKRYESSESEQSESEQSESESESESE